MQSRLLEKRKTTGKGRKTNDRMLRLVRVCVCVLCMSGCGGRSCFLSYWKMSGKKESTSQCGPVEHILLWGIELDSLTTQQCVHYYKYLLYLCLWQNIYNQGSLSSQQDQNLFKHETFRLLNHLYRGGFKAEACFPRVCYKITYEKLNEKPVLEVWVQNPLVNMETTGCVFLSSCCCHSKLESTMCTSGCPWANTIVGLCRCVYESLCVAVCVCVNKPGLHPTSG